MQSGAVLENRISSGPQYERALRPERLRSHAAQVTDHGGNGGSRRWVDSWRGSNNICLEVIHIEEWKPVRGYEGLYEVSSYGNVRSLCAGRWHYTMMRKPVPDKNGYHTVNLKKDGKYSNIKIHRLVAMAFLPNPDNLPEVNHKDENKANNYVDNLEWCTSRYNHLYNGLHSRIFCKPIIQLSADGTEIGRFASINEAGATTGTNVTCISMVLHKKRKKAGGYKWAFQS